MTQRTFAIANEIAKAWQAIGVKTAVQAVPASLLVQNILRPRQFDAVLYDWRTLSNDPDQYENWHQTQIPAGTGLGQNYSGLDDRDISVALESARATNDQAKRTELYTQFQELFADRVPGLLLYYPVYTYGIDSVVHGVQLAPMLMPSDRFRNVSQWYLKTQRVLPGSPGAKSRRVRQTSSRLTFRRHRRAAPTRRTHRYGAPRRRAAPTVPQPVAATLAVCESKRSHFVAADGCHDLRIGRDPRKRRRVPTCRIGNWSIGLTQRPPRCTFSSIVLKRLSQATVLSLWSTKTVANGPYWLQLSVVDNTGNFGTPCQIRVNIGN